MVNVMFSLEGDKRFILFALYKNKLNYKKYFWVNGNKIVFDRYSLPNEDYNNV